MPSQCLADEECTDTLKCLTLVSVKDGIKLNYKSFSPETQNNNYPKPIYNKLSHSSHCGLFCGQVGEKYLGSACF